MISVTTLSAYLYCKRKLFLERVLSIYEPEKEVLILGKAKHNILEKAQNSEKKIITSILRPMSKNEIFSLYKKEYSKIARNIILQYKSNLNKFNIKLIDFFKDSTQAIEPEIQFRAETVYDFLKNNKIYGEELWQKITPKITSEIYLESEELGLKGILDRIEVFEEYVLPVEFKSGKSPRESVWSGHMIQIGAYLYLLEKNHKKAEKGIINYLGNNQKRDVFLNPFLKQEIKNLIKKTGELLSSKKIPERCKEKAKCDVCGLKKECYSEKTLSEMELKLSTG